MAKDQQTDRYYDTEHHAKVVRRVLGTSIVVGLVLMLAIILALYFLRTN